MGHGLSCTRLGVGARTGAGEQLHRIWRCAEPLTPTGTVDRVRWQLDAWLARSPRPGGPGAVVRLWLVPEETVTAGVLQLGLWGEVGEADERAGRALVRVQAVLGPESVVTAVLVGGRDPAEQVRLVPWGDERETTPPAPPVGRARAPADRTVAGPERSLRSEPTALPMVSAREGDEARLVAPAGWPEDVVRRSGRVSAAEAGAAITGEGRPVRPRPTNRRRLPPPRRTTGRPVHEPPSSWPGRLPAPSPATVPASPLPAELVEAAGEPVRLAAPDLLSAPPQQLVVDGGGPRTVQGWAGPWPLRQRWWTADAAPASRLQVVCTDGTAFLLHARDGRWWVTGIYD